MHPALHSVRSLKQNCSDKWALWWLHSLLSKSAITPPAYMTTPGIKIKFTLFNVVTYQISLPNPSLRCVCSPFMLKLTNTLLLPFRILSTNPAAGARFLQRGLDSKYFVVTPQTPNTMTAMEKARGAECRCL